MADELKEQRMKNLTHVRTLSITPTVLLRPINVEEEVLEVPYSEEDFAKQLEEITNDKGMIVNF